jgi:F-type H+-transporting ATPase subunit gamma
MANLRDIRNRISSVNNTQQITKAMKMVAAAKLRKAQNRMTSMRPYATKLKEVVSRLGSSSDGSNALLRKPEEINRVLIVVVGSDKGLCGGFNNNLFKVVEKTVANEYQNFFKNDTLDLITIGRKSTQYFKKRSYNIVNEHPGFFDNLSYDITADIMEGVIEKYTSEYYDKVLISFNEFKTVIAQNRRAIQVLPVDPSSLKKDENEDDSLKTSDYLYEPDSESILEEILPVYVIMQLWRAVLESNASEQGARMAAMDNATENAKELEEELTLKYNQARQSAITTEISEIVSGAQALEES